MFVFACLSLLGACLCYGGMLYLNYPEPNTAGDRGMLFGLGLVVFAVGFFVCLTSLAIALSSLSRLDWVSKSSTLRLGLLLAATTAISVSLFFTAVLRAETWESTPAWLSMMARSHAMVWIPLPALISAFVILAGGSKSDSVLAFPQYLAIGSATIGIVFSLGLLVSWLQNSSVSQLQAIEEAQQKLDDSQQEDLERIEAFSADDSIQVLFPLAAAWKDEPVRSKALKKLESRQNWEDELFRLLDQKHVYRDIYLFLDGNRITDRTTDRKRFAEALERSLHRVADEISREVQKTNNLQSWSFEWCRIDSAIRAIDFQFADVGVDFVPAIRQILSALNENRPADFQNVKLDISNEIEKWLRKHGGR